MVDGKADTFQIFGCVARFRERYSETGMCTVIEALVVPGGGTPPHRHVEAHESCHVLEGRLEFRVGDVISMAEVGDFLSIPVGTLHGFRNPGPDPARVMMYGTPGEKHEALLEEVGERVVGGRFELPETLFEPDVIHLITAGDRMGLVFEVPDLVPEKPED